MEFNGSLISYWTLFCDILICQITGPSFSHGLDSEQKRGKEGEVKIVGTNVKAETISMMKKRSGIESQMNAIINRNNLCINNLL